MLRATLLAIPFLLLGGCNSSASYPSGESSAKSDETSVVPAQPSVSSDPQYDGKIRIEKTPELTEILTGKTINEQLSALYERFEPLLDRSDSLLGPDLNQDGLRDDLEAYIDALEVTELVRKAIKQSERQNQKILAYDFSQETEEARIRAYEIDRADTRARACMKYQGIDIDDKIETIRTLEALTFNSKARTFAYLAWNHQMDGAVITLLHAKAEYCE